MLFGHKVCDGGHQVKLDSVLDAVVYFCDVSPRLCPQSSQRDAFNYSTRSQTLVLSDLIQG